MAVHIVLVMHAPLGAAFANCAQHVLGHGAALTVVDVVADAPPEPYVAQLYQAWMRLPACDEILVLSDIYGATPFNIAVQALRLVHEEGRVTHLITGTNLCMVLKALTESSLSPQYFADSVRQGALRGIVNADGACHCAPGVQAYAQH